MGIGLTAWRGVHRRWGWLTAGLVVVLLLGAGAARALTADADGQPAAAATVRVDRGAVTTEVATTGTVEPAQTRSLSFAVGGTVDSVEVRAGTMVTVGQTLASIDDADAAEAADSARDALADARDALADAKDSAASTASGCGVVPAAYTGPAATPGSATPAATRTSAPAATTAPSRTTTPVPPGGPAPTTAAACAAQGDGRNAGAGGDAVLSAQQRVNQAEVAVLNAEDQLEGTTITAPMAGRILSVAGKVGSQVGSGAAFLTLADVSAMQVRAAFPEADADRLAVRQRATATLAGRAGEDFAATVVQVDPAGTDDGTMVRYGVLLSFTDPPEDLLVGQSAAVRITTGSATGVLRVPSTAVHDITGGTGTVLRDGAQVKVGVGLRGDRYTEIISGLAEGAAVTRSW
jgi:HlyD family secretion protein